MLVTDFDGTLAALAVDWTALRRRLGVIRVTELWALGNAAAWESVTAAEVVAAAQALPAAWLDVEPWAGRGFSILTANSERAIAAFLDRFPRLRARVIRVVGRESLGGDKAEPAVFRRGLTTCCAGDLDGVVYIGDSPYELGLARRCGARAIDVTSLAAPAKSRSADAVVVNSRRAPRSRP